MLFKFNVHSVVDVITNSSTTIYSYCDGSVKPAKELINEFLKVFGGEEFEGKTADDLFFIDVFCDDYVYAEYNEDGDAEDDPFEGVDDHYDFVNNLIKKILKGEIEKPQWMKDVENSEDYNYNHPSNEIYVVPKDEKYNNIATLMVKYLNSMDHEAGYD